MQHQPLKLDGAEPSSQPRFWFPPEAHTKDGQNMTQQIEKETAVAQAPGLVRQLIEHFTGSDAAAFRLTGFVVGFGQTVILVNKSGAHEVRVELSYTLDDLRYGGIITGVPHLQNVDEAGINSNMPAAQAAAKLLRSFGFELVHANTSALMPHFAFLLGKKIPTKETTIGIRAQLTTLDYQSGFFGDGA
jgi:hypothetical protein